ncbi:MAG: tetratricopeptide repeat protein [Gammaproteobacteria bacterium]|nr:tetratricopeptide repeat protein [Gammaproteobacteria bacterium]
MTEYLTEQEQLQQLVNWVKQYGPSILLGLLLAIVGTYAWHYWQNRQNDVLMRASNLYDTMLSAASVDNSTETVKQAKMLINQFPKTPYAQMAAFMLANEAISQHNLAEAKKHLQSVMTNAKDPGMRNIARIRLARLLIADHQPQVALKILDTFENDNAFSPLANEIRGDAALALHRIDDARKDYAAALKNIPNAESTRPILQLKYNDLATQFTN